MTELELCKIISDNLAELIKESGYSRCEVALEAGLDESTINKCLKGDRIPSVRTVINLAIALKCDLTDIIPDYDYID